MISSGVASRGAADTLPSALTGPCERPASVSRAGRRCRGSALPCLHSLVQTHFGRTTLVHSPFSTCQRPSVSTLASMGYRASGIAAEVASSQGTPRRRGKVTVTYVDTTDDVLVPAPASGKTLKINVDLMLWRCRQARIQAQLSLDENGRRELLKEAEAGLRRCLVLDSADARTYVVLGKLLMVQRRYDEARALYTQGCTNTGNTNPYIWSAWGWLEFKTGNIARARQLFDAATVVDDTHACAWHKWGLLEKSEGNYLRARDLWMRGIQRCKRKPQSQNAYLFNALAVMAAELQRVDEARAWFEEGTSSLEGAASVALWQAWAVLEAKQGDASAVRYLFRRALSANSRSRYVHLAWALWERQNCNLMACLELLRRGQIANPTDAALYQVKALVEWRDRGNAELARRVFEAGVRADPGHLPLWQAWGCMEAELGFHERARELFQQGVWADPRSRDTAYVLHAWGCLECGQGNLQLARELFKAAIKVDPKSEKVWFTWISMEEEAGFLERADELRIRQAEQQWEFEVPAGFTTRPSGSSAAAAAASPLSALRDTLTRFFSARSNQSGPVAPVPGSARNHLPSDYEADVTFEELLSTTLAAARQADSSAGSSGGQQAGADAAALALSSLVDQGQLGGGLLPQSGAQQMLQVLNSGGDLDEQQQAVQHGQQQAVQAVGSELLQPVLPAQADSSTGGVSDGSMAADVDSWGMSTPVRRAPLSGLSARPVRRPARPLQAQEGSKDTTDGSSSSVEG